MKTTFKIEGLAELDRALGELPKAIARPVLQRTLIKVGTPIKDAAQAAAPVRDADDPEVTFGSGKGLRIRRRGTMRALVQIGTRLTKSQARSVRKEGKDFAEVYIGTRDPIARLQERGTSKVPAQPFLRPAWEAGKMQALEGIKADLWLQIDTAAQRLARKAAKLAAKA